MVKTMIILILCSLPILLVSAAPPKLSKNGSNQEQLSETEIQKIANDGSDRLFASLQQTYQKLIPGIPETYWTEFKKKHERALQAKIENAVRKAMTTDDPVKAVHKASMKIGEEWGNDISPILENDLYQKGHMNDRIKNLLKKAREMRTKKNTNRRKKHNW